MRQAVWRAVSNPAQQVQETGMSSGSAASERLSDLLARVARQDKAAFEEVYRATSAKLYGIILRILRRPDVADELLQEIFLRIWQRAADFDRTRSSPITWMAAIARNRALDEVRLKAPVTVPEAPEALEVPDGGRSASELVELADDARRLAACMDRLEPERRSIVRLAYEAGLSREELAQQFSRPVATIKTWLHRSLKQLKDCMGE